jgi:hypothetical protein
MYPQAPAMSPYAFGHVSTCLWLCIYVHDWLCINAHGHGYTCRIGPAPAVKGLNMAVPCSPSAEFAYALWAAAQNLLLYIIESLITAMNQTNCI